MKAASSVPIADGTKPANNTTSNKDNLGTNSRMDASLEGDVMDSYQATKAFKKLIGTEIPATSKQKDNIKTIKGIGKHLEEGLNHLGINSFQQISSLTLVKNLRMI